MVLYRSNRYCRYPRTCLLIFLRRFRLFLLRCFLFMVLWFVVRLLVNCGCSTLIGGGCSCGGGCCGDRRRIFLDKTKVCNNKTGSGTSFGVRISTNRTGKLRRKSWTVRNTLVIMLVTLVVVVFSFWDCDDGVVPSSGVVRNFCKAKNPSYWSIRPCKVSKIVVVTLSDRASNAIVPIGKTNGVNEGFIKGSVCFQTKTSPESLLGSVLLFFLRF